MLIAEELSLQQKDMIIIDEEGRRGEGGLTGLWYHGTRGVVQHFTKVMEPGTKNRGTSTNPILVGTNNNSVNGCFWQS